MVGERLARGPLALERRTARVCAAACCAASSSSVAVASSSSSCKLHLLQQPRLALRAGAVELAPQLLDLELEMRDQRFGARKIRLGIGRLGLRGAPAERRLPPARARRARRGSSHARRQDRWEAIQKCRSRRRWNHIHPQPQAETSSHRGRTPSLLRMSPVDPGQKVAELRRRDRHHAIGRARPQEAARVPAAS